MEASVTGGASWPAPPLEALPAEDMAATRLATTPRTPADGAAASAAATAGAAALAAGAAAASPTAAAVVDGRLRSGSLGGVGRSSRRGTAAADDDAVLLLSSPLIDEAMRRQMVRASRCGDVSFDCEPRVCLRLVASSDDQSRPGVARFAVRPASASAADGRRWKRCHERQEWKCVVGG